MLRLLSAGWEQVKPRPNYFCHLVAKADGTAIHNFKDVLAPCIGLPASIELPLQLSLFIHGEPKILGLEVILKNHLVLPLHFQKRKQNPKKLNELLKIRSLVRN